MSDYTSHDEPLLDSDEAAKVASSPVYGVALTAFASIVGAAVGHYIGKESTSPEIRDMGTVAGAAILGGIAATAYWKCMRKNNTNQNNNTSNSPTPPAEV